MGNCCKKKADIVTSMDEFLDKQEDNPLGLKLSIEDFEKIKVLGKGSFGEVLLVKLRANNKFYAMKILNKKQVQLRHQEVHTKTERDVMVRINCPFIVNIKFAFQDNLKLYIITEFMQGGEMFFHMHKEDKFSNEKTRFYIVEIILGIEFLHKNNMLYRDLKPENIMIDEFGHIKLTDFGLSKMVKEPKDKAYTICGTPQYLAPEVLKDGGYDKTVDWWSLGCVMFEMLVGQPPFKIPKGGCLTPDIYKKKIYIPEYVTLEAKDLISKLLVTNPKKRLGHGIDGAKKIKEHPYFEGINWDDAWNRKLKPPFVPKLLGKTDLSYFDRMFTNEKIDENNLSEASSNDTNSNYSGFTYVTDSVSMELMDMIKNEKNN